MSIFTKAMAVLGLVAMLGLAQAPVRLVDRTATEINLGAVGGRWISGLTTISTSGTTITTAVTRVKTIHCRNNSASTATVTITDGGGAVYFPTNDVPVRGVMVVVYGDAGLTMSGITVTAGTVGVIACQIEGAQ